MYRIENLMLKAVSDNIFPGGVLLVVHKGMVEFFEAYGWANLFTRERMTRNTIFDLASLTKPLATTLAMMKLVNDCRLSLNQTIDNFLPGFANSSKSRINLEMLLRHTSGYPAHRPYYKTIEQLPIKERKQKVYDLLCKEPLVNPVGHTTVYSDLGFMLLAQIVRRVVDEGMDQWLMKHIYTRLGLTTLNFIRHFESLPKGFFAATELCPIRSKLLCGAVHDDNAYAMGGVCGHSGLFGAAKDVKQLLIVLLNTYHGKSSFSLFSPRLVRIFFRRPSKAGRALGFDVPSCGQSSSGAYFSWDSVGHLGFTGTSFWMDLRKEIIVILLTNRVHPHRNNDVIRKFRPVLHDAVMVALRCE
ncbi:MAG: serine hydrolase [Desulfobacteraceae bacterium]|jgi:CubicO group peptidase (beta-lactamase class C family)